MDSGARRVVFGPNGWCMTGVCTEEPPNIFRTTILLFFLICFVVHLGIFIDTNGVKCFSQKSSLWCGEWGAHIYIYICEVSIFGGGTQ